MKSRKSERYVRVLRIQQERAHERQLQFQIVNENGTMLEPYSELIRNQIAEQKASLKVHKREQFLENRLKFVKKLEQNEHDARLLILMPEEIWIMILNALDWEDKVNCSESSGLFMYMLKQTVYFPFYKTLPHFIEYLGYDDLLSCMRAYPDWRSSVLSVAQDRIDQECRIVKAKTPFQGQFKFAKTEIDQEFVEKYKTYNSIEIPLSAYSQNCEMSELFSGKNVTLIASYHPGFFTKFVKFLNSRAHQIQYLTLVGQEISISPAMLYMLCHQVLKNCVNLKGFTVEGWRFVNWTNSNTDVVASVMAQAPLMDHKNLEKLNVNLGHPLSLTIVDRLMTKYDKQLKYVSVTILEQPYYQIYNNFEFSSLSEICAIRGNISEVFLLLKQIIAPNLQKLTVTLDKSAPNLDLFLSVVWNFPKLFLLDLRVSLCFRGWTNMQILNASPSQCAGHYLEKLKITLPHKDTCLDFLICFPHLKELDFAFSEIPDYNYTPNSEKWYKGAKNMHVKEYKNFAITDTDLQSNAQAHEGITTDIINQQTQTNNNLLDAAVPLFGEIKRRSANDLIRLEILPGYPLKIDVKIHKVHESNIWELLPSLQIIRLSDNNKLFRKPVTITRNATFDIKLQSQFKNSDKLYSRDKCNWINLDYATKLENRISVIQNKMNKRNKEKCLKIRDGFKNANITVQRNLLTIINKTRSFISDELWERIQKCLKFPQDVNNFPELAKILYDTKTQTLFSEVFPIIYNKLSRNDTLKCRMVCHKWTEAVDQFLENVPATHQLVPMKKNLTRFFETFKFWYPVQIPSEHDLFPELMRQHSRNPFVSRSIEIIVNSFTLFGMGFDDSLAKHIWNVKITFLKSLNPLEYFELCLEAVKTFPNLKFLYIGNVDIDWIPHDKEEIDFKSELEIIPPLNTLIIHSCANIQHIHAKLLPLFWTQLKRLVVTWNGTELSYAPNVCRNNIIQELEIPSTWRVNFLKSLKSPHLKYLCTELNEKQGDVKFLNMFGDIISSGLQTLKISVSKYFTGFREAALVHYHPALASTITKLILTVQYIDNFSFDMLILFPYLKKLELQINSWALSLYPLDSSSDLGGDFMHFKKFLFENDDKLAIYKSKVWQLLPYIELIKIVVRDASISKIFTRAEYNAQNDRPSDEEMTNE